MLRCPIPLILSFCAKCVADGSCSYSIALVTLNRESLMMADLCFYPTLGEEMFRELC